MTYQIAILVALAPACAFAQGTFAVRLDASRYLGAPDIPVAIGVQIDPVPENGIFSFGFKLFFESTAFKVDGAGAVRIASALDHDGPFTTSGFKAIEPGSVTVRGSADPLALPPQVLTGSTLATIFLTDTGAVPGTDYPLRLEIFRALGPTETVFVSGLGVPLDDRITFGNAILTVVPEPAPLCLVALGSVLCWLGHGRGHA